MDIATLGIAVDSSGVVRATGALDAMAVSAKKTEAATTAVAKASVNSGYALRGVMQQLNQVAQMGVVTGNYTGALLMQLPDIMGGLGSLPAMLAGAGIAVAGSMLMASSAVKDTDDTAKQFEATLNRIKDVAPEVADAIERALKGNRSQSSVAADLAQGARDFESQYRQAIENVTAQMQGIPTPGEGRNWAAAYNNVEMVKNAIGQMGVALENGSLSAEDALAKLDAMATAETTPPSLYTTIDALRQVIQQALNAKAALAQMSGEAAKTSRVGATQIDLNADKANQYGANKDLLARMGVIDTAQITKDLNDQTKALNAVAKAAAGAAKEDPYKRIVEGADRRIASLQTEAQALGMTEQAAAALKYTQDLLNQADSANITLSQTQIAQLQQKAAQMASLQETVRRYNETQQLATSSAEGFLSTLRQGLVNGEGWWKSMGDAALSVLDKIAGAIETQIANQLVSSGLGGLFGNLFGGGFNPVGKVGLFASGTNYAPGGMAIVGEQGPELVNLPRGSQVIPNHRLAANGNSQEVHVTVSIDDNGGLHAFVDRRATATSAKVTRAGLEAFSRNQLPSRVNEIAANRRKVGK